MKGDVPAIAVQLSASLPRRVHEWRPAASTSSLHPRKRNTAFVMDGRTFRSIQEARRVLRVGQQKIMRWLETGEAKRI